MSGSLDFIEIKKNLAEDGVFGKFCKIGFNFLHLTVVIFLVWDDIISGPDSFDLIRFKPESKLIY